MEKNKPKIPRRKELKTLYELSFPGYERLIIELEQQIQKLIYQYEINATVTYRIKSFESYFNKIIRLLKQNTQSLIINDLMGLRVICPFLEDTDKVEKILKRHLDVIECEHKGEHFSLSEFGYQSLHLLANLPSDSLKAESLPYTRPVFEIQLRTILQEAWAEVEHELVYKAGFSLLSEPIKRKMAALNATLTLSDLIFQEIREYHRAIQASGKKRRENLQEKIEQFNHISILPTLNEVKSLTLPIQPIEIESTGHLQQLLLEALDAHGKNQLDRAIKLYSRILRLQDNNYVQAIVYNHRGMAYFMLGEYQKSIDDFTQALKLKPDYFRAYNNRGITYRMLHQYVEALADLEHSLELNAYQTDAYYIQALSYFDLEDYTKALENCEKALNLKSNFEPANRLKKMIALKIFT